MAHPALIDADDIEMLTGDHAATPLREVYGYRPEWGRVSADQRDDLVALMTGTRDERPPRTTSPVR